MFSEFFGFGDQEQTGKRQFKGEDITVNLDIEFMEAVKGVKKEIQI